MKDIRYNISLYIIIPVIISGIALLSMVLTYNVSGFYYRKGLAPELPMLIWGALLVGATFVIGLVITRMLVSPLRQFIQKTEELGVLDRLEIDDSALSSTDEVGRFNQLFEQVTELLSQVDAKELFPHLVGQSKAMRGVFNQIMKVAPTDSTVLVLGETGTGKELITQSLFEHSLRKDRPFVAINCAAIPEGLLESELFGHEKGAFTGADSRKLGKFEAANGGSIFLDEIGDMPLETQSKILRVIEEGHVERVGGLRTIPVDVRLIAATNQDLSEMVEKGLFRQDLYFRLNVFTIQLPPLRNRREDIPLLVERFLDNSNKKLTISPESLQLLTAYNWPGNVRELKNTVEAASVLAQDVINPVHLPSNITREWSVAEESKRENRNTKGLDHRLKELEKGMIIEALTRSAGVQVQAAKYLGIKERSLWHRIKKYNIDVASFKNSGA